MTLALEVLPDARQAALRAAAIVAARARAAIAQRGAFSVALSGGTTPAEMFRSLAEERLPWPSISVYQVDERVASAGHPERNLTTLLTALPAEARTSIRPLPVEDPDLDGAAQRYAAQLPEQLDLVHLGLGDDGHTASLVPGDDVLDVRDRLVALTGEYEGYRRMTLTYAALEAAREILWLVTGDGKRAALSRLLAGDGSIPAVRIANPSQLVVADEAASLEHRPQQ